MIGSLSEIRASRAPSVQCATPPQDGMVLQRAPQAAQVYGSNSTAVQVAVWSSSHSLQPWSGFPGLFPGWPQDGPTDCTVCQTGGGKVVFGPSHKTTASWW